MLKSFLFFFLLSTNVNAQLTGNVIKVTDGDTFVLLDEKNVQHKIRLHGIDAPEKRQPFGTVAKVKLSGVLFNKTVIVQYKSKDRYGRKIGIVFLDSMLINEWLLREGLAWHFTKYDQNPDWQQLEETARKEKKGLWALPHPIAPWNWRTQKKAAK